MTPSKKPILPLFVFIDACGWEIASAHSFCKKICPTQRRLESVFGYSSACIPSILSGRWPSEHYNWCYFVHDPARSPFRALRPLRWIPRAISSRRITRRLLSRMLKVHLKFRGYFDLYNIPFKHIAQFDFSEKKSPLLPRGMNHGPHVFDYLEEEGIPYHVSDPAKSEVANLAALLSDIEQKKIDFAFLYWPDLDGLLHQHGNQSMKIFEKLKVYESWIQNLMEVARANYEEVRLYVFSDHGMANCDELLDLKSRVEELPCEMGRDYTVVYDSTMARFWFFNDRARTSIAELLGKIPEGRILSDEELEDLGASFPDRYFGELIFLVREGVLIVPSHMGERPIRGMHGYHPSDPQSYASLLTNQTSIPGHVQAIPHIFTLMVDAADEAKERNRLSLNEAALEA
jgi:predicted AlkP superfamily pyrophosphatase or phosphodiesterase